MDDNEKLKEEKMRADIFHVIAETSKMQAETNNIKISTLLAPALAAAALMGGTAAIVKLFF